MPSRRSVLAFVLAFSLVATGAVVVGVSYEAADRLVHPPRETSARTPETVGLGFARERLVTDDGLHLSAWWIPVAAPGAPTVVFLHGYGASKVQALDVAPFLHAAGYNVLAFDFRAHGESEGTYTTFGLDEVLDVRAALAWLHDFAAVNDTRVALFGWSMGAAAALNSARATGEIHVAALVLDSPFAALDDVTSTAFQRETGLPAHPFAELSVRIASWMIHKSVEDDRPVDRARGLTLPLLIIQGLSDSLVPRQDAVELHEAAGESELWLVPHADHVDAVHTDPQGYEQHVLEFLAASLA